MYRNKKTYTQERVQRLLEHDFNNISFQSQNIAKFKANIEGSMNEYNKNSFSVYKI